MTENVSSPKSQLETIFRSQDKMDEAWKKAVLERQVTLKTNTTHWLSFITPSLESLFAALESKPDIAKAPDNGWKTKDGYRERTITLVIPRGSSFIKVQVHQKEKISGQSSNLDTLTIQIDQGLAHQEAFHLHMSPFENMMFKYTADGKEIKIGYLPIPAESPQFNYDLTYASPGAIRQFEEVKLSGQGTIRDPQVASEKLLFLSNRIVKLFANRRGTVIV